MATKTELFSIFLSMLIIDVGQTKQSPAILPNNWFIFDWGDWGHFHYHQEMLDPDRANFCWAQRPTNYGKLFFNNIAGNRILEASDRSGKLESWNHFKCPISFNCSCDTILHWFATMATLSLLRQHGSPGHWQASFYFSSKELLKNVRLYRKHF